MTIVYNIYRQVGVQLTFSEFFDYDLVTLDKDNIFIDLDLDKSDLLPHTKRK